MCIVLTETYVCVCVLVAWATIFCLFFVSPVVDCLSKQRCVIYFYFETKLNAKKKTSFGVFFLFVCDLCWVTHRVVDFDNHHHYI